MKYGLLVAGNLSRSTRSSLTFSGRVRCALLLGSEFLTKYTENTEQRGFSSSDPINFKLAICMG